MRIKASEEGQYEVSTKLYGQHITHSPVIVPVMNDPEKHLVEMGIFLSDQNAIKSSAQVGSMFKTLENKYIMGPRGK